MSHTNAYMWNLEKMVLTNLFAGEQQLASGKLLYITENSVLCDDGDEWDGAWWEPQEGGDVQIHIVGSLHCTAEMNTTL